MNMKLYEQVEEKILEIRGQKVILDADVAVLYGVVTRDINKAVKNNPDKFPNGYILQLSKDEKIELVENFHRFNSLKHSNALPNVFTEKGIYMLATILRSSKATETTLAIIDTFARVREINRTVKTIAKFDEGSSKQKRFLQKAGELISDLVQPEEIVRSESEASVELNLAVVKLKYSKKKKTEKNNA